MLQNKTMKMCTYSIQNHGGKVSQRIRWLVIGKTTTHDSTNTVFKSEQHLSFGKDKIGLLSIILMVGFTGTVISTTEKDVTMTNDKSKDGVKQQVLGVGLDWR